MKRKRNLDSLLHWEWSNSDVSDRCKRENRPSTVSRLTKFIYFVVLNSILVATSHAQTTDCQAGYECSNGVQVQCKEGFYSLEGETKCTRCPEGSYCPTATNPPLECGEGEYSIGGSTECIKCPKGFVCKLYNGATQFIRCPLGQWSEEGGNVCLSTPIGHYSASPAQPPEPCFDGYYTTTENSTYCTLCTRGHQCKQKDREPQICPEGTYAGIGSIECAKCPEDMYCPQGAHRPQECPVGNPNCRQLQNFISEVTSERRQLTSCASAGTFWDGTTCKTCPEGYSCAGGTANPVRCTINTQYSAAGASSCSSCGAGYICPTTRATDRYQCAAGFVKDGYYCRPCAEGKYCTGGNHEASCTAGTNYSPGGLSACLNCPAGKECNVYTYIDCTEGFYINGGVCTPCPAGSYCQNNVATECSDGEYQPFTGFTFCFQCPVNAYCPTADPRNSYTNCTHDYEYAPPGSTSCTVCEVNHECFVGYSVPCPSNYYSNLGDFECHKCPEGKSCTVGSPNVQTTCTTGYYSPAGAMNCYQCPEGHMCPHTGMSKPTPCRPGQYQNSVGQISCSSCSNGYFSNTKGADTCIALPSGHYSGASKGVSLPCPVGTYPTANKQGCQACTAGYLCGIGESTASPSYAKCPLGYYCPVSSSKVVLEPCPAGKYGTTEGQSSEGAACSSCPQGFFCPGGTGMPISCPVNAYCPLGASAPTVCASGSYNKLQGQYDPSVCISCSTAPYCAQDATGLPCNSVNCAANSPTSVSCSAGTYMPIDRIDDTSTATSGDCEACPLGHYCEAGIIEPVPCPVGTFRNTTGAVDVSGCTQCTAGSACPFVGIVDEESVVPCSAGHYCPTGTQYPSDNPCPAGKYSENTDNDHVDDCGDCPAGYGCPEGTNSPPVECQAGYYCEAGSTTSTDQPCPAGTYSPNTGLTSSTECLDCPAGSYCEEGSVAVTGLCEAGYWCPIGSSTGQQNACPAGTYSASTGLKTVDQCTTCPLGYICATTAMTAPVKCAAGTYGPTAGIGASSTTCTTCPAGYYCAEGVSAPTACGKGYYSVDGSKDAGSPVCTLCEAGYYCAKTATTSTDKTQCGAGFICPAGTNTVPSHPAYSCPAGYYCGAGVAVGTACSKGTYNPSSGKSTVAACLTVPAGYYADVEGTTSIASNVCPAGYYCLQGAQSSTANPCPAGTYRSLAGAVQESDCATCPTGYYCGVSTVTPVECPQGYYCTLGISEPIKCPKAYYGASSNLRAEEECTICPQGRYCSQAGLSAPDGLCDPGYYCLSGSTSPAPPTRRRMLIDENGKRRLDSGTGGQCEAGGYCEQGSKYRTRCPPGTWSDQPGQDEASDCIACTDGHYCIGTINPTTSGKCTAGYYCYNNSTAPTQHVAEPGYKAEEGAATQEACSEGTYNPFYAQSSCITCIAGYYCPNTGMSEMMECPAGQYCEEGTITPVDCPAGTYNDRKKLKAESECKACPPGKYCPQKSTSAALTCSAGYYCRASATVQNPSGSATNFGVCPAGHYCPVGTGDPIQCPPGTFNPSTQQSLPTACQSCTAGKYCSKPGLSAVEGPCPAGYICPLGTNVKYPATFCDRGYKCPEGSSVAVKCPAGSYQNAKRQGYCRECPAGYLCDEESVGFSSNECPTGQYCPAGRSTGINCPAGTYNPYMKKKQLSDCIDCDPGSYCSTAGIAAVTGNCTAGYYCTLASTTATPSASDTFGGPCTAGYYCPEQAVRKIPCPPKKYCSGSQLQAPSGDCTAGYYCTGLATTATPTDGITGDICPAGAYCETGTSSPVPCNPGTFNPNTGSTSSAACGACTGGSYCSEIGAIAVTGTCDVGFYCPAGSTVAKQNICQAGYKCPAGSPDQVQCPSASGEYQDQKGQGTCKVCAAGYICTATSRTLCRPDTSSLSFYCPAAQYDSEPCAAGYVTNVIGAESSSDCVACPPGYYCPNSTTLAKTVECQAGTFCAGGVSTSAGTDTCPIGHYCPAGTNEPRKCTPGYYCGTTGLQSPTANCTAGYYCLEGSQTATPTDGVQGNECPAGSYCVSGSAINIECPVGKYNPDTGKTQLSDCLTCPDGKRCQSRGLTTYSSDCPAGYYCTQNPFVQTPCTAGNKCPAGSDAETQCPSGEYQMYILQASCDACPIGFYCDQADTSMKTICPTGHYCTANLATPTDCPAGRYNVREGGAQLSDCEQCPYGKYCGSDGLNTTGSDCAAGYFCTRGASTSTQTICPAGYYCPASTTAPIPCPAGTYNPLTGKSLTTHCLDCDVGKYCPDTAATSQVSSANCVAGYYCISGARTPRPLDGITGRLCNAGYYCTAGATTETLCPKGTYNPYSGMSSCLSCPAGYYCDGTTDTTTYIICPAGYYCPTGTSGTENRFICPAGTYSDKTGLPSSAYCTQCDPGKYCSGGGTSPTGNCDPGYVCPRGASTATPSAAYINDPTSGSYNQPGVCPQGYYCPSGSYYPRPCAVGQYQPNTGQSSCIDCPNGFYCDKTAITSTEITSRLCYEGHFCSGGTKVEKPIKTSHSGNVCSTGKYCPTGTTTEQLCAGGYYDNRRGSPSCMPCPAGYYCASGARQPIVCPAGMYCGAMSAAGTLCPNGTYNTVTGLEESAQCRPCPASKYCQNGEIKGSCDAGYFCDSGAKAADDSDKECPTNHYCEAGTGTAVRCESGKINSNTKGTSPSDCTDCPAGSYCPETNHGIAIDCPKGFYCVAGVTQPTACGVGTYVDLLNSDSGLDCIACPAGTLCNEEGVGDLAKFQCPVGYYCELGVKEAAKCPEGTYRNTVGAKSASECLECPDGFYCPEATIQPIICEAGTYCEAGSNETTPCTEGYYCPPETETPIICPQAYYCPEGTESYIKCVNGTYCPEGSAEPTLCPSGTFGNGNPNNYDQFVACAICDAGTYSITSDPGYCFPCTAGYVCLGNTTTSTPNDADTENGYDCPRGYYCPEGSKSETACPKGTYTEVFRTKALDDCKNCATNTYNNETGAVGCSQCGSSSYSGIGATECTCIGEGREWSLQNNQCLCGKGYKPIDKLKSEDSDSDENCELISKVTCLDTEAFDVLTNTCMEQEAYCALQCNGIGDGSGTYHSETTTCTCNELGDYDTICDSTGCDTQDYFKLTTSGTIVVINGTTGEEVSGSEQELTAIEGVWGSPECNRIDEDCTSTKLSVSGSQFVFDGTESSIVTSRLRNLGIARPPSFRRVLASTTTITNPVTCITAGNMIEFSVDSDTKSYPEYMVDSLLNTNENFDYSGFTNLADTIEAGTASTAITTYVHTFSTEGVYIFMNSLDNYQQMIIKVAAETSTCSSSSAVQAATLTSLYSLNLSSSKTSSGKANTNFIYRLIAAKIGLLVLLVGFVTYMHSVDKSWTLCPCLRKKSEDDDDNKYKSEEEKRRMKALKEKHDREVKLKAEELQHIRDELARYIATLKKKIQEMEDERRRKIAENRQFEIDNQNKLLKTLSLLKKYVRKRAKVIRNEAGHDFEKEMRQRQLDKYFKEQNKEDDMYDIELKRKQLKGEDHKFEIDESLKEGLDREVENRELEKLDKAQEETRHQLGNYLDEERQKLEERLRREGKLSENEIENILNDYDLHTRDMAQMLKEDEKRQQENFRRQLEARKNRRRKVLDDIEKLKNDRAKAKEIEAKELEKHFKKQKEEENYVLGKILVDEEKEMRAKLDKEMEQKKKAKLKGFESKLKRAKDKDEFKDLLDEYTQREKEVEAELNNERKLALMQIQAKINERKRKEKMRISAMKPEESSVNVGAIEKKIEEKMKILEQEAEDEISEQLEEERRKRQIQAELSYLRKENDEYIKNLRNLNEEKYIDYCDELNRKYKDLDDDEDLLGLGGDAQELREELADTVSALRHVKDDAQRKKLQARIAQLKKELAEATKDGKDEEKMKNKNEMLKERARLAEEKQAKLREFRLKCYAEEEKEREALNRKEREEWLRREKEAIDAVVDRYLKDNNCDGLAEMLDQVYGAGSKVYADRLLDQMNKLQEKKARRLKQSFNDNLVEKALSKSMNPQIKKLKAKQHLLPKEEFIKQLKDLMMKENERMAEIEAIAANREADAQTKIMFQFIEEQKGMIDELNGDMKDLREYAFDPRKIKDKIFKEEAKKLKEKYDKEFERLQKEEEAAKQRQIDELNNRFQKNRDELEKNRKDFEKLCMFEKQLENDNESNERFKRQNYNLMMDQLNKERDKLGKELTEDEKALMMQRYERKMKNLSKALEKEHERQLKGHSRQLMTKQKELEMRKRERELLLNSLSMYKDYRAEQIANEDNFKRLCLIIEEDLEVIDHEAYSYKPMKIYDLIKWKREADEYLDALGGEATLLQRVAQIEKHVGNLNLSSFARIRNLVNKIK